MPESHLFSFGQLEFFNSYAIITCNEGANIDFDEISQIEDILLPVYGRREFGLIANRQNSYSVNPLAVDKLFSYENLVAGAIVGHTFVVKRNAKIENDLIQNAPIMFFEDLKSAINWVHTIVSSSL